MGAYDGAEVCELVGLYILNKLDRMIGKNQLRIYNDDGLAAVSLTCTKIEGLKKRYVPVVQRIRPRGDRPLMVIQHKQIS